MPRCRYIGRRCAGKPLLLLMAFSEADVELTFDPPWDKSMMSEEARLELGFF